MKLELKVEGNPVPKPRMTKSDKWKKRPIVIRYYNWRDDIIEAWLKIPKEERDKHTYKYYQVSGIFLIPGYRKKDVDNLIKGVKDALSGLAWKDDAIDYIPQYSHFGGYRLCDYCNEKKCKISTCEKGLMIFWIEPAVMPQWTLDIIGQHLGKNFKENNNGK